MGVVRFAAMVLAVVGCVFLALLLSSETSFARQQLARSFLIKFPIAAGQDKLNTEQMPEAQASKPSARQGSPVCDWGTLQGVWQPAQAAGARWVVLDKHCSLKNLLPVYLDNGTASTATSKAISEAEGSAAGSASNGTGSASKGSSNATCSGSSSKSSTPRRGILFLGDSVDNHVVDSFCSQFANGEQFGEHSDRDVLHTCRSACNGLDMGMWYIPGVSLTGPYNEHLVGNALERTTLAYKAWEQAFGGKPHVVVMSSNLWDVPLVRMAMERARKQMQYELLKPTPGWIDGGLPWVNFITPSYLDSWQQNFTAWVQHTQRLNPAALHIYHTEAIPHFDYNTGQTREPALVHAGLVHALNVLGRHTAQALGLLSVDFEAMTAGLPPNQYLQDAHHSNMWLHQEAFNIILNYLEIHAAGRVTGLY